MHNIKSELQPSDWLIDVAKEVRGLVSDPAVMVWWGEQVLQYLKDCEIAELAAEDWHQGRVKCAEMALARQGHVDSQGQDLSIQCVHVRRCIEVGCWVPLEYTKRSGEATAKWVRGRNEIAESALAEQGRTATCVTQYADPPRKGLVFEVLQVQLSVTVACLLPPKYAGDEPECESIFPLPDRPLTLPEKAAVLAVIHDKYYRHETPINPVLPTWQEEWESDQRRSDSDAAISAEARFNASIDHYDGLVDLVDVLNGDDDRLRLEAFLTYVRGVVPKAQVPSEGDADPTGTGMPVVATLGQPKPSKQVKRAHWIAEAIMMLRDDPKLSGRQIAKAVGVSPSTLSRCTEYKRMKESCTAREVPRGEVKIDPNTGLKDIEAVTYDPEPDFRF